MTVQSITLRNFQRHRRLRVRLDPQITVLTGSSDRGKSAVVRALSWLTLNDFPTAAALRHDSARVKVSANVDGVRLSRSAGSGGNAYRLGDRTFRAFGQGVPEPVARLLNLRPENVQSQLDPPFWLSLTPGQVAGELNEVVNLEAIDRAAAEAASRLRRARATAEVCRERLGAARRRRKALGWTVPLGERLERLEKHAKALADNKLRLDGLESLVADAETQIGVIRGYGNLNAVAASVGVLAGCYEANLRAANRLANLERLNDMATSIEQELQGNKRRLQQAEQALREKTKGRCPTCGAKLALP